MKRFTLIFIISFLVISCSSSQSNSTIISASDLQKTVSEVSSLQLIDVRTPEEFEKGHINDAVNINFNDPNFDQLLGKLDPAQPVYVYCLSGGRSAQATQKLVQKGFEVKEMRGGMMEWRANQLPEVSSVTNSTGLTLEQYENLLKSEKLVLIDFYATWCAPCKKMEPYLSRISEELKEEVVVIRLDADSNTELCKALNVKGLPVLKLYKKGELIWDQLGFVEEQVVREKINNNKAIN